MTNFSIGKLKFFKREVFFVQVYYDAARKGTVGIPLKFQWLQLLKKFNHMTARIATCTVTFTLETGVYFPKLRDDHQGNLFTFEFPQAYVNRKTKKQSIVLCAKSR